MELFYFRELEAENANLKEEYNHLKIVGQMPMTVSSLNQPDVTGTNCNTTDCAKKQRLVIQVALRI